MFTACLILLGVAFVLGTLGSLVQEAACRLLRIEVYEVKFGAGPSWKFGKNRWELGIIPIGGYVSYDRSPGLRRALPLVCRQLAELSFAYSVLVLLGAQQYFRVFAEGAYRAARYAKIPQPFLQWLNEPTIGIAFRGAICVLALCSIVELTPFGKAGRRLLIGLFESLSGKVVSRRLDNMLQKTFRNVGLAFVAVPVLEMWSQIVVFLVVIRLLLICVSPRRRERAEMIIRVILERIRQTNPLVRKDYMELGR